jgi:RimJ/RimL family protein N-acetyltransferase
MFIEVNVENQIEIVTTLAKEIWTEHYISIIGKDQTEYMIDKFQSKEAISNQLKSGYSYYLIQEEGGYVGYMAIQLKSDELFLSKLYIKSSVRGKGYGKRAVKFLEDLATEKNMKKITLTVNKGNVNSIKAYEKMGFKNLGSIVIDIDNGFVMDDYKMEKVI